MLKWSRPAQIIGMSLGEVQATVPKENVHLTGARGKAVLKVFGRDIYNAINDGPNRKNEIKEGKHRT